MASRFDFLGFHGPIRIFTEDGIREATPEEVEKLIAIAERDDEIHRESMRFLYQCDKERRERGERAISQMVTGFGGLLVVLVASAIARVLFE